MGDGIQWRIEGRNGADHSYRKTDGEGHSVFLIGSTIDRYHFAGNALRFLSADEQRLYSPRDLILGICDSEAAFCDDSRREVLTPRIQQLGASAQNLVASVRR